MDDLGWKLEESRTRTNTRAERHPLSAVVIARRRSRRIGFISSTANQQVVQPIAPLPQASTAVLHWIAAITGLEFKRSRSKRRVSYLLLQFLQTQGISIATRIRRVALLHKIAKKAIRARKQNSSGSISWGYHLWLAWTPLQLTPHFRVWSTRAALFHKFRASPSFTDVSNNQSILQEQLRTYKIALTLVHGKKVLENKFPSIQMYYEFAKETC